MYGTPVTIVGNLTGDPELRFTPTGDAVVKFSVAFNRRVFDRQANEWKDGTTDFHRVTAWRQLAQNIAETLTKGSRVIVQGDLRMRTWTDEKTNEPRSAWEITADAVGAELTWATATVKKTAKSAANQAPPDDPWNTASRERPAGAWPTATAGAPAAGGSSSNPPF